MPYEGSVITITNATKHDRFLRTAPGRVDKALGALANIGLLANAGNEFTEAEADRIIEALDRGLEDVKSRLRGEKREKQRFSFG